MTVAQNQAVELFFSYAHEDDALRKALEKHLSTLMRQGRITQWHDRKIIAGQKWSQEIDTHLNTAQIILLLISADYTASDYCCSHEMQHAMERHYKGEVRVIPIILRPTDWKGTLFEKLQVLPTNAKPVISWPNPDEAFLNIVEGIRTVIEDLQKQPPSEHAASYPIATLPYERNMFFTGREEILNRLHETFKTGETTAITQAIIGLGGMGKTQTTLEYVYRHQNEYEIILWAHVESQETLLASVTSIAQMLHLSQQEEQDPTRLISAVQHWLQTHARWLLVLDNSDDLAVLKAFLPVRTQGHVLITTRTHAVGYLAHRTEIKQMDPEEGVLFLLRRAAHLGCNEPLSYVPESEQALAREISDLLDGLPLALDQAGAYIEETGCSLSEYLQLCKTRQAELLRRRGKQAQHHPDPVATTWSLSFEKVQQANSAAIELLFLCSFLDPDTIPMEIITRGASVLGPTLKQVGLDPIKLNETVGELLTYSLVHRNPDQTLTMHRLVQAVLKNTMTKKTRRIWATRAVRAINRAFPEVTYENWLHCLHYLPQVQQCTILIDTWNMTFKETTHLLTEASVYLWQSGAYAQAIPLLQRALDICERELGEEHPNTARCLNNLAVLYRNLGQYEKAELFFQRALDICERVLGAKHPDTARCLNNLAELYHNQRQYEKAEPFYQRALDICECALGAEHPDTATSLNNLAALYDKQGQYEKAESFFRRALDTYERMLGAEHPDTARSQSNLAALYHNQRQYEKAEPFFRRALDICERVLGAKHPDTARALHNLASLYSDQGQHEQAESLYQRALAIQERVLGPEHPDTKKSQENYASFQKKRKQKEKEVHST